MGGRQGQGLKVCTAGWCFYFSIGFCQVCQQKASEQTTCVCSVECPIRKYPFDGFSRRRHNWTPLLCLTQEGKKFRMIDQNDGIRYQPSATGSLHRACSEPRRAKTFMGLPNVVRCIGDQTFMASDSVGIDPLLSKERLNNLYLSRPYLSLRLRGGNQTQYVSAVSLARKEERFQKRQEKRKALMKKRVHTGPHIEPWRHLRPGFDLESKSHDLEVRKMTSEGNHILRVGKVWSKRGIKMRAAAKRKQERLEAGLKKRKKAIAKAEEELQVRKTKSNPLEDSTGKSIAELERNLVKMKHEMIRYKDHMYGTTDWKNMTAHTVPHSLRHVEVVREGEDIELYKNLKEARSIVFCHNKATTASPEALLRLMNFFGHECMKLHMQVGLLNLKGVKTVAYLSLIGGGHLMLRRPSGKNPFGSKQSLGGKRPKDPILAAAGCEMLLGTSRKNPQITCRLVKLNMMQHLVDMGLLFTRHFKVMEPLLNALAHLARLRGRLMPQWKLRLLRGPAGDGVGGALELVARALKTHPLHFRVKRAACDCAVALISGEAGGAFGWRVQARGLLLRANITGLAEEGLDVSNYFVGSRLQARRAVFTLRRRVLGRDAVPLSWLKGPAAAALRPLSKEEARTMMRKGRLPWNAGEVQAAAAPNEDPDDRARRQATRARLGGPRPKRRRRPWAAVPAEEHPIIAPKRLPARKSPWRKRRHTAAGARKKRAAPAGQQGLTSA